MNKQFKEKVDKSRKMTANGRTIIAGTNNQRRQTIVSDRYQIVTTMLLGCVLENDCIAYVELSTTTGFLKVAAG